MPNFAVRLAETVVMTTTVVVTADTPEAARDLAVEQANQGHFRDLYWADPPCCDSIEAWGDEPATETNAPATCWVDGEDDEDEDEDDGDEVDDYQVFVDGQSVEAP